MANLNKVIRKINTAKKLSTEDKVDLGVELADAHMEEMNSIDDKVAKAREVLENVPDNADSSLEAEGVDLSTLAKPAGKKKRKPVKK